MFFRGFCFIIREAYNYGQFKESNTTLSAYNYLKTCQIVIFSVIMNCNMQEMKKKIEQIQRVLITNVSFAPIRTLLTANLHKHRGRPFKKTLSDSCSGDRSMCVSERLNCSHEGFPLECTLPCLKARSRTGRRD